MQRWKKSMVIFSFILWLLIIVNCQDYFGYSPYPMFGGSPFSGSSFGSGSLYEDAYYKPMLRRSFGQPNGYAMSHDSFDQEKTMDERISARMNPLPYLLVFRCFLISLF